ncbi:DoxX family protein [Microbacterium hydrocarbonoxydans]|uniref:DoxX family protein n=1 Tax=Microbacterium hydrocarbonoxydans TaxID=273678 RepID=UPI00203AA0CA|nr:hypothetical protein [Microbacterium hydrocarbonoxydans]MCM3780410.1 hypothetical protein [Microbacterium hydrocarbonoxydans]
MLKDAARWSLALLLATAGVMHFVSTRGFRIVVPDWATRATRLDKDAIVLASGAVEVGLGAALIALPRQRRRIGVATAAFFVAVFPGNVHQWRTGRSAPGLDTDRRRLGRLFLQPVLVGWALWCTSGRQPTARRRIRRGRS